MKFMCGNCGELIRESPSPMACEGWQVHEACGHETFFAKFVVREREKDKQPVALRVRVIGDRSEGISVEQHKSEPAPLPSAADLDAAAKEQKIAEATSGTNESSSVASDGDAHVVDDAPRKKGKGAK